MLSVILVSLCKARSQLLKPGLEVLDVGAAEGAQRTRRKAALEKNRCCPVAEVYIACALNGLVLNYGGLDSRLGGLIFEFRATVPAATRTAVLMESGYKCGNPACRNILTLGLHHIVWVRDGGGNAAMRRARFKRWTGRSRASPEQRPGS